MHVLLLGLLEVRDGSCHDLVLLALKLYASCTLHDAAGCEDKYIISLANEVRKILGVYEDRKLLQGFLDEKLVENFEDDDDKLLQAFQEEEKLMQDFEEGKLLVEYESNRKPLKSFDDRQLLDKCEAIVC